MRADEEPRAFAQSAHSMAAESVGDLPFKVAANLYYGASCIPVSNLRQAKDHLETVLQLLPGELSRERFGLHGFPAPLVGHYLAWALAELGEFDAAIARSKDAIQVAEAVDHAYSVAVAQWGLAYAYVQRGELESALRLLERSIALCRDWTVPILLHISAGLHGIALARSEHVTEGIAVLREAERSFKEAVGAGTYNTLHVLWLGEAYALGRRYPEALEAARRALELVREFNHSAYEGWVLHLLGEIACQSNPADLESAEGHYRRALALAGEHGTRPLAARCHAGLLKPDRKTLDTLWTMVPHWAAASDLPFGPGPSRPRVSSRERP